MIHLFIEVYFRLVMRIYNRVSNNRINYLKAPDYIVSSKSKHRLMMFFHFFPTIVLSILVTVKILPNFSEEVCQLLKNNSPQLWIYSFINWLIISYTLGYFIEKGMELINPVYKELKSKTNLI